MRHCVRNCSRSEHYNDEALCSNALLFPLFIRCRQYEPKAGPLPDEIDPAGDTAGQHLIVRYSMSVLYTGNQQTGLNRKRSPALLAITPMPTSADRKVRDGVPVQPVQ